MKDLIRSMPIVGPLATRIHRKLFAKSHAAERPFDGSADYWEGRYADGGNSGVGSYGRFAEFKAEVLNAFVADNQIKTIIEFGCGDGNQLTLAHYPEYLGVDVSETAIAQCRKKFRHDPAKQFMLLSDYRGERAELAMSLDVIYHLIEDSVFDAYMRTLFAAATRHVVIYASNTDENSASSPHVRHRQFTRWVESHSPDWRLQRHIPNRYPYRGDYHTGSFADFYLYGKNTKGAC